jgi:Zn-finger nucleic acid-binding protein
MRCHECRHEMRALRIDDVLTYVCAECNGAVVTTALLRRMVPKDRFNALWRAVRESVARGMRLCPTCKRRMQFVDARVTDDASVELDGCASCQLIWFDPAELERFSPEGMALRPIEKRRKTALDRLPVEGRIRKYHGDDAVGREFGEGAAAFGGDGWNASILDALWAALRVFGTVRF